MALIWLQAVLLAACSAEADQQVVNKMSRQNAMVFQQASAENYAEVVQKIYVGYFGRPADVGGLAYFQNLFLQIGAPTTIRELSEAYDRDAVIRSVIDSFGTSQESNELYPGSNAVFIGAIYRNLFSRAPDEAGQAYWVNLLDRGLITRAQAAVVLMAGAQGDDVGIIERKTQAALLFTSKLTTPADTAAYSGPAANVLVRSMLGEVNLSTSPAAVQSAVDGALRNLHATVGTGTNRLLISAWNPDGTKASIQDFVNFTHYRNGKWSAYQNYGLFKLGNAPATRQIGSDISLHMKNGAEYIAIDAPNNLPLYFTALWKAPVIGTVFMRADNKGDGFFVDSTKQHTLELPYDFAVSEYAQAQRLLTAELSKEAQTLRNSASTALAEASNASNPSLRALAAYKALSYILPLKEQLVLDSANRQIAASGRRADFDLNYEGFGSWIDVKNAAGYAAAKDAGFRSVLLNVEWHRISAHKGTLDFSVLDYQIDQARKLGFNVALNVNNNTKMLPAWAKDLAFNDLKTLYYENARTVVSRYGDKVSWYYAASELELETGEMSLDQVVELAKQSVDGARSVAPSKAFGIYVSASAYVSYQMNPVAKTTYFSGFDLMRELKSKNINFDFVGLEMQYGTTFAPIDLQRFKEVLQHMHDVAKMPIYMGETGYSSRTEDYGIPAAFHWRSGMNQQTQYEWADGTLRTLYAMPFVKGYYWVHLDPDDYDYGSDYLSTLIGTGLLRADGSPKKVVNAFTNFNAELARLPVSAR